MFVKGFSEILLADLPSVGGKGANLGEMAWLNRLKSIINRLRI